MQKVIYPICIAVTILSIIFAQVSISKEKIAYSKYQREVANVEHLKKMLEKKDAEFDSLKKAYDNSTAYIQELKEVIESLPSKKQLSELLSTISDCENQISKTELELKIIKAAIERKQLKKAKEKIKEILKNLEELKIETDHTKIRVEGFNQKKLIK